MVFILFYFYFRSGNFIVFNFQLSSTKLKFLNPVSEFQTFKNIFYSDEQVLNPLVFRDTPNKLNISYYLTKFKIKYQKGTIISNCIQCEFQKFRKCFFGRNKSKNRMK